MRRTVLIWLIAGLVNTLPSYAYGQQPDTAQERTPQLLTGTLGPGDRTLRSGEYADVYLVDGHPGQRLRAVLTSSDFDTYLVILGPRRDRRENDDSAGSREHSAIDMSLRESGQYQVVVTSYRQGEVGEYNLSLDFDGEATPAMAAAGGGGGSASIRPLPMGATLTGSLDEEDRRLFGGEFHDLFEFRGEQGDRIVIVLESTDFDTYLALITPSGRALHNDDWKGRDDRSRIEVTLREPGRYRVVVTSEAARERGRYSIRLSGADRLLRVAQASRSEVDPGS